FGGLVPWRSPVRATAGTAVGTFFRSIYGRVRNAALLILDSSDELMDADPAGLPDRRRTFRASGLVCDRLQSILSLSTAAYRHRLLHHHCLCGDGRGGLA